MTEANGQEQDRRPIEELLPWYAAGTLSRSEMRRVQDAIAKDPALARSYELVREELDGTAALYDSLGEPSARAKAKLFANIDAEPKRQPVRKSGLAERLSEFLASLQPRTLAWSASAVAFALVLQAGLIGNFVLNRQPEFGLASGEGPAAPADAFALIRFVPAASAADITQLLEANKLSIADGPLPGGLYRLRAAEGRPGQAEIDAIIALLSQENTVDFVAPSN